MGQIIKVQRPVSSTSITGLYVISEATFTIALLGVLLYKYICNSNYFIGIKFKFTLYIPTVLISFVNVYDIFELLCE